MKRRSTVTGLIAITGDDGSSSDGGGVIIDGQNTEEIAEIFNNCKRLATKLDLDNILFMQYRTAPPEVITLYIYIYTQIQYIHSNISIVLF